MSSGHSAPRALVTLQPFGDPNKQILVTDHTGKPMSLNMGPGVASTNQITSFTVPVNRDLFVLNATTAQQTRYAKQARPVIVPTTYLHTYTFMFL